MQLFYFIMVAPTHLGYLCGPGLKPDVCLAQSLQGFLDFSTHSNQGKGFPSSESKTAVVQGHNPHDVQIVVRLIYEIIYGLTHGKKFTEYHNLPWIISILSFTGHHHIACLVLALWAACPASCDSWHMDKAGEEWQDIEPPWAAAGTEPPCPGSCTQTGPAKCLFPGSMPRNSLPPPVASEGLFASHHINCAPATWPRAGTSPAGLIRKASEGISAYFARELPVQRVPPKQEDELIQTPHHHGSKRENNPYLFIYLFTYLFICSFNKWVNAEHYEVVQWKNQPCQISPQIYPQRQSEYDKVCVVALKVVLLINVVIYLFIYLL